MRSMLLAAARSGRIEELRTPLEWNEMKPSFGADTVPDPISLLRTLSADGEGREILAAIVEILEMGAAPFATPPPTARAKGGKSAPAAAPSLYVWPYLAELPLASLTPEEQVDLFRLVPAAEAKAMLDKGRYTGWRLVIGADGTWHSLVRGE